MSRTMNIQSTKADKKAEKGYFFAFEQQGYEIPKPNEKTSQSCRKMVLYGDDNRYSQMLWQLYEETAIFQTLVNNLLDYICGDDITFKRATSLFEQSEDEIKEIARKCALDFIIYNACSVQRIRNKAKVLVRIAYLDQTKVRYNEGLTCIYYADDWKAYTKEYTEIPLNDESADTDAVTYRAICKGIYPTPLYNGALKSIIIANKIDTYHLNNISNGFSASAIINFNNGVPDKKEKSAIESQIKEKFAGEKNAGKFIVTFNETGENAATVASLSGDDFDAKYQALRTNYEQNIVVAFRCPAQLLGFSTQNTTFNTIEYVAAFDLYNRTMVQPMQKALLRFFRKVFGADLITIEPYKVTLNDADNYDSNKSIQ